MANPLLNYDEFVDLADYKQIWRVWFPGLCPETEGIVYVGTMLPSLSAGVGTYWVRKKGKLASRRLPNLTYLQFLVFEPITEKEYFQSVLANGQIEWFT